MVGRAVVDKEEDANLFDYKSIRQDDFTTLHQVTTGRYLLSVKGLGALYDKSAFSEIRFDCKKRSHGRRLHLKTKGSEILMWLLKRRRAFPPPPSCGSYTRLDGDTSMIGRDCRKWLANAHQTWNFQEIYSLPMRAVDKSRNYHYIIGLNYKLYYHLYCDDYQWNSGKFSHRGEWQFFIR